MAIIARTSPTIVDVGVKTISIIPRSPDISHPELSISLIPTQNLTMEQKSLSDSN